MSRILVRPGWLLAALLGATALAAAALVDPRTGALRLGIDPTASRMLPAEGPARERYERARQLFGSDEPFVIALGADDVFRPDVLERVLDLTQRLEALPHVHHVVSLARVPDVISSEGEIEIVPMLEAVPRDAASLERLRRDALGNPLYRGALVAADGRTTALYVYLERLSETELVASGIADRIEQVAREEVPGGAGGVQVWISGVPHATAKISEILLRELAFMLPLTGLALCVVLALAFRSVHGVVLPIATVTMALLWTLGALAAAGQRLNLITTVVPPLVVTVGFTYAMHVVSEFGRRQLAYPPADRVARVALARHTVEEVGVPVLLSGLTTVAGFLSLVFSPLAAIREFGLFALFGLLCTTIAALTFTPAALALWPTPPPRAIGERDVFARTAERLAGFAAGHRRAVIGAAIALLALSAWGSTRIRVATEFVGNFDRRVPLRADYEAINERLGGANVLQIAVETDVPEAFLEPANLRELEALQAWLAAQPEIGGSASIVDYVKFVNRALHDGAAEQWAIPPTKRMTSQLLLFGSSDETKRLVDARYQMANVIVRATVGDSGGIADLVQRIDGRLAALPPHLRADVTGNLVLFSESLDLVTGGQWQSLAIAFALIYALLALLFTSWRVGLLALFPNAVPIALYYGALGFTGVTLNPWTSLVAEIALGIAVDDTIHLFSHFNAEAKRLADERRAVVSTMRGLARPVFFASLGLCVGFLVLTTSQIRSQAEFGALSAFTLGAALVCDFLLTPALCSGLRVVTLWDVLSLDLGAEPQRQIPLFQGLSARQMRIFVLMGSERALRTGELLFREGDAGRHAYLVLAGHLRASLRRDDGRIPLEDFARGAVAGELGLFVQRRSADVTALADTRLVRFDPDDLERLRRRYPRTAAVIYRNLNRIQSERVLATTGRVR